MEIDNCRQEILNQQLFKAVCADSVARVREALEAGADIHAWEGYFLTLALYSCKNWHDDSTLRLIADTMFGTNAFSTIVALNSIGYDDSEITKALCASHANKNAETPAAELPNNIG